MASVTPVDRGTGGAPSFPAAPTGLQGHTIGQRCGGEGQPTGDTVVDNDRASDPDRMTAPPASLTLILEGVELLGGDPPCNRAEHLPVRRHRAVGAVLLAWGGSSATLYKANQANFDRMDTNEYQHMTGDDSAYQGTKIL